MNFTCWVKWSEHQIFLVSGVQIPTWARQFFLPFFFFFFSKLGFVNEKWDTSKKSYFSLVLSERKVYCVFAFFYVHGFFLCLQSMQQAENPSFIQRLLYHPAVGIVSLTRFLRGFLAQFSMFYWPAMYCKSRLAFVCNAYYVYIRYHLRIF